MLAAPCCSRCGTRTAGSYGVCPLYALTGLWCPACGGLRATHDLAHGDLAGAWAMNPLWVLAVPLVHARPWSTSTRASGASSPGQPYEVEDLVTGAQWTWSDHNFVMLDAFTEPVHILHVKGPR